MANYLWPIIFLKPLFFTNFFYFHPCSISFELMELTFQHWLPNFNECWWDYWILDVAVCNAIGIVTGMWTVRYFKSKVYNWRGISQQPNLVAKARRGLLQFTPHTFDDFQWNVFSSPKRCLQCFFPVVCILLFEVNHFFLKYELWVPPRNPLNTIRLSILFLMALPGIKVRRISNYRLIFSECSCFSLCFVHPNFCVFEEGIACYCIYKTINILLISYISFLK